MEIQKIANVDVLQTERVRFAVWLLRCTRRLVIDLLSDIASVSVQRIFTRRWTLFSTRYRLPLFVELRIWCFCAPSCRRISYPCRCSSRQWRDVRSRTIFPPWFSPHRDAAANTNANTEYIRGNCLRLLYLLFYPTWQNFSIGIFELDRISNT